MQNESFRGANTFMILVNYFYNMYFCYFLKCTKAVFDAFSYLKDKLKILKLGSISDNRSDFENTQIYYYIAHAGLFHKTIIAQIIVSNGFLMVL